MTIRLIGWKQFGANHDRRVIRSWLGKVRRDARRVYTRGLTGGPHTGRIYARGGGRFHQASINRGGQEFPHSDTGRLLASMKDRQTENSAVIGTNMHYAVFLRLGTGKMKRRRMSTEAMREGAMMARSASRGWVKFRKGKQDVKPY